MTWLADLDALKGDRALDVGTGAGHFARELATRYREVVGIDRPEAIGRAEPHAGITFEGMDAEALSFPDESFDLVALCWALHHLKNPTCVIDEMYRVLKPGGIFLLVEPFVVETGTNQDLHLDAHQTVAEADRAHGKPHFPIFQRMQIGSIMQGLKLVDVAFNPLMGLPEEAAWDLPTCIEGGSFFAGKLDAVAADGTLGENLRERAAALAARIRLEGMRTSPAMRTYGYKPSKGS